MNIILCNIPEDVTLDSNIFVYTDTTKYYESSCRIPENSVTSKKLFERHGKDHKYNGDLATRLLPERTLEIIIDTLEELIELSKALYRYNINLDIEDGNVSWVYYPRD